MHVISVLNQKGGSGKTTLSVNLARSLILSGYKVLLVDSDPQGSARDWNEANNGDLVPVIGLDRETLHKDLQAVYDGYNFVIIDGAPQLEKMSAVAIKASDLVLIPCQPSPYDVWATDSLVELVKVRQEITSGELKAAFVVSRAIKGTKLSGEIIGALNEYELPILETVTHQRVAYPTTAATGRTVFDSMDTMAKLEIIGIQSEVLSMLGISQAQGIH